MTGSHESGNPYPQLLSWLRYFCAFMLYMYGISKLAHLQFNMSAELAPRPIGSLNGYQLTWFYYGYSRVYASILGLTQVAGATLLLFRKTTLLAVLMLIPMMANILLINMFIMVNDYGPYLVSAVIVISLLVVLWNQRKALINLLWVEQAAEPPDARILHRWIRISIVLAVSSIMISGELLQRHYGHK